METRVLRASSTTSMYKSIAHIHRKLQVSPMGIPLYRLPPSEICAPGQRKLGTSSPARIGQYKYQHPGTSLHFVEARPSTEVQGCFPQRACGALALVFLGSKEHRDNYS